MKPDVVFALENAAWPAFLVDGSGAIRRANQAAINAFGGLEGESTLLSAIWSPENSITAEQFLAQWERAPSALTPLKLRGKGGVNASHPACVCSITKDGQKYFLIQLLPDASADPPASPPPEAQLQVDAGLAHKQKLDCALQLARTVSLDFNNALTSILGHASLVLSKMEPNNPWRNSLVEVEKSAAKAAEIANDLAAFSRNEKEQHAQASGNLNIILQRDVDMFQSAQMDKVVDWSVQLERKLYAARFDEAKMQQAFVKLIENAIEALGPRGRISVQSKNIDVTESTQDRNTQLAAGAYVCVEISDSGSGIEPDVLPRIFEPFFTTKRAGNHRGLGLAWVYGIITNHGGGVAVSSQPGVGTSVRVYIPADKKFVKDNGGDTRDLTGSQTVLMVDDEDLLLTLGQTILSAYGYKVLTANSGQKALEILSRPETHVDLIITDLVMPAMSGRELVEHAHRLSPDTRVLCTSGYVHPSSEDEGEGASYLQKPFTSQELLVKVKHALTDGEAASND
jgi:signal transduction histidine kinase/ActR/RegA family two-component response regulator